MQYKFKIQDREAGNFIDNFTSLEDAEFALEQYEQEDKQGENFTPNFYEIEEV